MLSEQIILWSLCGCMMNVYYDITIAIYIIRAWCTVCHPRSGTNIQKYYRWKTFSMSKINIQSVIQIIIFAYINSLANHSYTISILQTKDGQHPGVQCISGDFIVFGCGYSFHCQGILTCHSKFCNSQPEVVETCSEYSCGHTFHYQSDLIQHSKFCL